MSLKELNSEGEFPKEMDNFKQVLEKIEKYK